MLDFLKVKYYQFLEHWRAEGFWAALKFSLYKYEEAVPVTKDLQHLKPPPELSDTDYSLIEITPDNYRNLGVQHILKSRTERVERYIRKGYRSFGIVKNNQIIGDLWYVTRATARTDIIHPHVKWFDIPLGPTEVYMFDMYMSPGKRGEGLTTFFMNSTLHLLHDKGFTRAYGYFAAHNIPALWVHRLLGWEEMRRFKVQRFFLFETAKPKH